MSGGRLTTTLTWKDGVCFEAETGSGHRVAMDGAPDAGGRNRGSRPMELILAGLGGCGGFDVARILREAGQDVRGMSVRIDAERADATPAVFKHIRCVFVVRGRDLDEALVARAVRDSAEKYSSVSRMLEQTAKLTYDYEVEDE